MAKDKKIYPNITIKLIKNPNRFYAIPLLGFLVKNIMLIPVSVYIFILSLANIFILISNSFYIFFTGNYWKTAYTFTVGLIRLQAKTAFFLYGMTDTYPGFSFETDDTLAVTIPYPKNPSKFFAIPIIGFLLRLILLIPYLIYSMIINRAASIALGVGSFFVTFTGKYPESGYEINRDSFRISTASCMWISGLSDTYPSFWISMNHKVIKIVLITLAIIITIASYGSDLIDTTSTKNRYQHHYNNTQYIHLRK